MVAATLATVDRNSDALEPVSSGAASVTPKAAGEDALALEFAKRHGDELRYVPAWHRWLRWNSGLWEEDETLLHFSLARALCRAAAAEEPIKPVAARLGAAATVAAVVRLAQCDVRLVRAVEDFDTDPLEINTPGGVIDLRTLAVRPHSRLDCFTKSTRVAPGGSSPRWAECLKKWTDGDDELIGYLQRLSGYALTGSTREHVFAFLYGAGRNGKSSFLAALLHVLGSYAQVASADVFIATSAERHPADLAALRGARLVVAQEVEPGRRWAEGRLKRFVSGDAMSARYMRGDFFTFEPTAKLLIAGNNKPSLRHVDEAMRRRLHLIPFDTTIPVAEVDADLIDKLKAEASGILGWALEGCAEWQANGLQAPERVRAASEAYFTCQDSLSAWLTEVAVLRPGLVCPTSVLFASWRSWAEASGEFVGSSRELAQRLDGMGLQRVKDVAGCRGHGFRGVGMPSNGSCD